MKVASHSPKGRMQSISCMTRMCFLPLPFGRHTTMPLLDKCAATRTTNTSDAPSPGRIQDKSQSIPQQIRIKNRRKRYLEAHPEYFGPSLESAGMYKFRITPHLERNTAKSMTTQNLYLYHLTRYHTNHALVSLFLSFPLLLLSLPSSP